MSATHPIQRGFTLVEVIIVIVITGIIGGMVAMFLRWPVQNYVDSAGRAELTDIADTAVRRIERELRLAVPNSVRISPSGRAIEFVPTKAGGRYLSGEDEAVGNHLDFSDSSKLTFKVVGAMPTAKQAIAAGDFIVINNLGDGNAPADVYAAAPQQNRAQVAGVNQASRTVTLASNPFALQVPSMSHPLHRFLVTSQPVTYGCVGGTLYRYASYGFNAAQVEAPVSDNRRTILATSIATTGGNADCQFSYAAAGTTRTGLVGISIKLQRSGGSDGPIALVKQIHVDNTP